jgi:DNA (cytosine-5)-methyltransferase 1
LDSTADQDPGLVLSNPLATKLLETFDIKQLVGKQIKDKRGGRNNIHSWQLGLKGEVAAREQELMSRILRQRRRKNWALEKGIPWSDGMPLTVEDIWTFAGDIYGSKNELQKALMELLEQRYLAFEPPKKGLGPHGFNIVVGKLSFDISHVLDPSKATPTLVATDVTRLAVPTQDGRLRRLSTREGFRLFGFPESYQIPSELPYSKVFDLLGNSVTLNVVEMVSERLLRAL